MKTFRYIAWKLVLLACLAAYAVAYGFLWKNHVGQAICMVLLAGVLKHFADFVETLL